MALGILILITNRISGTFKMEEQETGKGAMAGNWHYTENLIELIPENEYQKENV